MSHPTVPYGQPGGPATVVVPAGQSLPSWNQQQQMVQQPQPAQQPQPQVFMPQQQQQTQQFQPVPAQPAQFHSPLPPAPAQLQGFPFQQAAPVQQQQQQQQQQQPRQVIPDNLVLDGDNIPLELRGRTWGQVRQIYGALADGFITNNPRAVPAPRPNMPGQPPQQQQQQQPATQRPAQPEDDDTRRFWENPGQFVREAVNQGIAPVIQRGTVDAAREAHQIAQSQIPDYAQLAGELQRVAQGVPPELLADVDFWMSSADLARGRMIRNGTYRNGPQMQQPQNQQPQQPAPRFGPGMSVPAQHQFFTESPTPPTNGGYNFGGGNQSQFDLTPEQKEVARKFGMSEQEYKDWGATMQVQNSQRRSW